MLTARHYMDTAIWTQKIALYGNLNICIVLQDDQNPEAPRENFVQRLSCGFPPRSSVSKVTRLTAVLIEMVVVAHVSVSVAQRPLCPSSISHEEREIIAENAAAISSQWSGCWRLHGLCEVAGIWPTDGASIVRRCVNNRGEWYAPSSLSSSLSVSKAHSSGTPRMGLANLGK